MWNSHRPEFGQRAHTFYLKNVKEKRYKLLRLRGEGRPTMKSIKLVIRLD